MKAVIEMDVEVAGDLEPAELIRRVLVSMGPSHLAHQRDPDSPRPKRAGKVVWDPSSIRVTVKS